MHQSMLLRVCRIALPVLFVSAFAACGGSASETPWPVEPKGTALGPAGESTNTDIPEAAETPEDSAEEGAPKQKTAPESVEP